MIIQSLLDTDLYKFTMMQVVLHHFPAAEVEYRYKCRTPGINLQPYIDEIRHEIAGLCQLRFTESELDYLRGLRFIRSDFVDFLRLFQLQERLISVEQAAEAGELDIRVRGPWLHTILFEVPVLAIINEVYFRNQVPEPDVGEGYRRLHEKIGLIQEATRLDYFSLADYGTRRRFSRDWQREVVSQLRDALPAQFVGSSNVYLASQLGLTPMGTMAHEYLQACQALGPRLRDTQIFAFETWAKEYRGDLGIALSDVYSLDAFLRDFDLYFCKLFDGARHDSGDPIVWGERLIAHYKKHRIDPRSKTLVFSDALTIPRALELAHHFHRQCKVAFGIGTHLTNDLGYTPLQIVMKMVRCNGQPVAKLSDTPGKTMSDDDNYLAYLRQVFEIPAPPV